MSSINSLIIKERRKALGMSQEVLANKLGVSKVAICWYETGERNLSLDELTGREINVVAENEEEYKVKLPKRDLEIIGEIKKYKNLYKTLYNDPVRTTKLIDKRMK